MEFEQLIRERYSVRKFSDAPVEEEKLQKILEAGRLAPTGHNSQPQRIYVIESEEGIAKIPFRGGEAPLFSQIVYRQSDLCTHGLIKKLAAAIAQATA